MWPQQRQQQQYRTAGDPEAQHRQQYRDGGINEVQHRSQRHLMHSMAGHSLSTSQQAQDSLGIGSHHQHSMHSIQQHQFSQQHQHHNNPTTIPGSSNPRASRNMAEKQRRDNLNTNISTMATLVPTVAGSSRRLDKISILRLAAAYLRTQYTLGSGTSGFLPRQFNDFDLEQYIVDNLVGTDGFILVVTSTGKIVYISRQIEQQLGHAQNDLLGQSLYNYVYPEDHEELTRNLTLEEPTNQLMIAETSAMDDNSNSSEESARNNDRQFGEQRRSFNLRMSQRTVSRREHTQYECLHISGLLRPAQACRNVDPDGARARHREFNSTSNDVVFVGMARLMKKRITELSLLEANKEEYVTRHLVDGRIIFCDHRISIVAGYMTQEVSGMSAFGYMHAEDVMWTIIGLRQMYDRGEGYATSCYRLKTKTGEYIYLRTHAFVEVDKEKQSFQSFVCINTSVSKEEGERLVNEMKARYAATISDREALFPSENVPALGMDSHRSTPKVCVESLADPSQLENAISHLVNDLASPAASEDRLSPSPLPDDTQIVKAVLISQRLPPASIHANQVGIKKIDSIPSVSKDKYQTMKREANHGSPASTHSQQYDNSSDFEEPRQRSQVHLSPSRQTGATCSNARRGDKIMPGIVSTSAARQIVLPSEKTRTSEKPMFHSHETATNMRYVSRGKDFCKIEGMSSSSSMVDEETLRSESTDQFMPLPSTLSTLSTSSGTTIVAHRGKPDNMSAYVKTEKTESAVDDSAEQQNSSYVVKRIHPDDSVSLSGKRRRKERIGPYPQADIAIVEDIDPASTYYGNSEQMPFVRYPEAQGLNPAAVNCKVEQLLGFSNNTNERPDADSPISSLHDLGDDFEQHIIDCSNNPTGYEDDRFPDLQGDPLLSPGLDNNPDLMKMFDDLRPVIGFENSLDDRRLHQLSNDDQIVNEELRRTHMQLANSMDLQGSQLDGIERDLENSVFQTQIFKPRERLTELRAEQKKNTRMLKNIQQDHHNMQVIVKQNIGV